jgi:hypothetical protein
LTVSPAFGNVYYNYDQRFSHSPVDGDEPKGRSVKNCVGTPPPDKLDKKFWNVTGDNLVVDDGRVDVDEDTGAGTTIKVQCPLNCAAGFGLDPVAGHGLWEPFVPFESVKSCDELAVEHNANPLKAETAWDNAASGSSSLVCSGSVDLTSQQCANSGSSLPFADAKTFCADMGARLCTATELQGDEAVGTGCGYFDTSNPMRLWSQTECTLVSGDDDTTSTTIGHLAAWASSAQGAAGDTVCLDDATSSSTADGATITHQVFGSCCADTVPAYFYPSEAQPSNPLWSLPSDTSTLLRGSGKYSDDSSICLAALHSGAFRKHEYGMVVVTLERGILDRDSAGVANGSTAFGVTSQDMDVSDGDDPNGGSSRLFSVAP